MKKKILASNGTGAYVQQNLEVLPDATSATLGQIATVTAGGTVAFVDPFLKSGGTIGGALVATNFKLPNVAYPNLVDNGSDDSYLNIRVIQNKSALNQDGLYIGYANNGNAQNKIYDGTSGNAIVLGSATFSSIGFTKFLFGNQADNGTFAQFSGAIHAKSSLIVDGTFSFGDAGTRTERTTDAGVVSYSKSGFYEALNATNFPINDSSWWHLINATHSNSYAGNNYAMQISGSFFDQRIYFRKTSTNATQVWREFVTSDLAGNVTISGAMISTIGINVTGNGGVFNSANKFALDFYNGNTRFYSNGANTTTKGGYEFHGNSSNGSLDNISMFIGSTGSVGFGTNTPIGSFDVKLTTNQHIQFLSNVNGADNGASGIVCIDDTNSYYTPLGFYASRYSFGNGRVGIGTNTPNSRLDVSGDINTSGALNLGGSGFAYWDGSYQRIVKRNGVATFSISNTATYYDNTTQYFRIDGGVQVAQIDADGVSTPYKFKGAKMMLGSSVDNGSILQVTGSATISGFTVLGENLGMNNGQYHYWKDSAGNYLKLVGLSANNMLFGDIDNSVTNSANIYSANYGHSFYTNAIEAARLTQGSFKFFNTLGGLGEFARISALNTVGTQTEAASIAFIRDSISDGNYGAIVFNTLNAEAMRISSSRNVGINTTTPQYKLDVNGSFGIRGSFTSPTRLITGPTSTYSILATDHVVIIDTSPACVFNVDAPSASNVGREIVLVNKSIGTQYLNRNYINSSRNSTTDLPYNTTIRLRYDGTNLQQI